MLHPVGLVSVVLAVLTLGAVRPSTDAAVVRAGSGPVILSDSFDDPTARVLAEGSPNPAWRMRHDEGEYVIEKTDPAFTRLPWSLLPDAYGDAALVVDVRLVGETEGRYAAVGCRTNPSPQDGYQLWLDPAAGRFRLSRWDRNIDSTLVPWSSSPFIRRDTAMNRAELRCVGTTISARINGVEVAAVEDGMYAAGRMYIGVSSFTDASPRTAAARFDNLVVYDPQLGEPPLP